MEKNIEVYTLAELLGAKSHSEIFDTEYREIPWIIPDLIGPGFTILAGPPKVGKSWLALQIAKSIAFGNDFLGKKVEQGRVLYLALEDSERRLKQRTQIQGWSPTTNVDFVDLKKFALAKNPDQTLTDGFINATRHSNYKLIIFDTFSRSFHINQNKVEEVNLVIDPLQKLAIDLDIGFLMIDHHRKPGPQMPKDPITDVIGSTAKTGTADTILGLYKKINSSSGKLIGTGRDIGEIAYFLTFDSENGLWKIDNEAKIKELGDQQAKVYQHLLSGGKFQEAKISKTLELDKGNLHKILKKLEEKGLSKMTKEKGLNYWMATSLN